MRVVPFHFLMMVTWLLSSYGMTQDTVSIDHAEKAIRKLGDADSQVRESAFRELDSQAPALRTALRNIDTYRNDLEGLRARWILQNLEGLDAQKAFLLAIRNPWLKALRDGRLIGPLLGVAEMGAPPVRLKLGRLPAPRRSGTRPTAIEFLVRAQGPDGRWDSRAWGAQTPADVEQTAWALQALLAAQQTEKQGTCQESVRKAVQWLKSRQRKDGAIVNVGWSRVDGVTHALATTAVAYAAGKADVPDTVKAAQRAIDFAALQQDPIRGGFRRGSACIPDLFTTVFYFEAFLSAKLSGLNVHGKTFERLIKFMDIIEDKQEKSFSYVPGGTPSARAAVLALRCRSLLGWKKDQLRDNVLATLKELGELTVGRKDTDLLGNQFAGHIAWSHDAWSCWSAPVTKELLAKQIRQGPVAGAWAPTGVWAGGGYILSTSVNCLHFPSYPVHSAIHREQAEQDRRRAIGLQE